MLHFYAPSVEDTFEFIPNGELPAFRRQQYINGVFRTAPDDAQGMFLTVPDNEPPLVSNIPDGQMTAYIAGNYSSEFDMVIGAIYINDNSHQFTRTYANSNNKFDRLRHPAGELLATTHAINIAIKAGAKTIEIMHTYPSVAKWVQADFHPKSNTAYQYQQTVQQAQNHIQINFTQIPRENLIPAQKYVQERCDWTITN